MIPILKVNNNIPYYFSQDDVLKIFSIIYNFKHYTMLNVLFYCCLRAVSFALLMMKMLILTHLLSGSKKVKATKKAYAS